MMRPGMDRLDSVLPNDSASHTGREESPEASAVTGAVEDLPFAFKFKAPSGRVHRLQVVASAGLAELISVVAGKLGTEAESIGGLPTLNDQGKLSPGGFALSYMDNEGDTVSITTDHDLMEAIDLARQAHKDKVDLFVHDPEKPALSVTVEPRPDLPAIPPTPPESLVRRRKQYDGEDEEEEELPNVTERRSKKSGAQTKPAEQPQVIAGVPNELLLPGAIAVLAGVIVITFAIGRASSK